MYHSITFIDANDETVQRNTWDDWHLIPSSRPVIAPPGVQTKTIEIPGMNGTLDLTEAATGFVSYKNRTGNLEFYVVNDYWNWEVAYSTIMQFLHGRRLRCILEDDPTYFYEGRFAVSDWKSEKVNSKITFQYDIYPYKKELVSINEPWLWDPFNFTNGVIQYAGTINAGETVTIVGNDEPIVPTFSFYNVNGSVTVTHRYLGVVPTVVATHTVTSNGARRFQDILFRKGQNEIVTEGSGTILISYRGGML